MKTNGILSKIDSLRQIIDELGQQEAVAPSRESFAKGAAQLDHLKEKISKEKFYLVVIGLFKRGKSSLVNAFVQREIAPYSVVPLTSVVTLVEYGETDSARIVFHDNHVEPCCIESIEEYVTEVQNPLNKKNVDYVNVFIKSDFLRKVTLVDTPGIGSTFENNTQTTFGFIERIDAALFILSADLPISKTEVEFLHRLKSTVPRIIFVLNKTDLLGKEETESILAFNKDVLGNVFGIDSITITPVSAKLALEGIQKNNEGLVERSGFNALADEIGAMLLTDKQEVLAASAHNQFNSLLHKTETLLRIQLKALLTPIEKLNDDYTEFVNSVEMMKKDRGDFTILMNGKVKQLQEYVRNVLYGFGDELFQKFCGEINADRGAFFRNIRAQGIGPVHEEYLRSIEESYEPLKSQLEKEIVERFQNIVTEYANGSNRFLKELVRNFSDQSLFELRDLVEVFDLKIITVFYFYFDKTYSPFCLAVSPLRKVALDLFRKRIINQFQTSLKRNIDMNTGRINYDITYKIQESFRNFTFRLGSTIDDTLDTLSGIISETISRKKETEESVSEKVRYLSSKLEQLCPLRSPV